MMTMWNNLPSFMEIAHSFRKKLLPDLLMGFSVLITRTTFNKIQKAGIIYFFPKFIPSIHKGINYFRYKPRVMFISLRRGYLRSIYKPHSVRSRGILLKAISQLDGFNLDDHLSGPVVANRFVRSTRDSRETSSFPSTMMRTLSLLDLAQNGGCLAAALLQTPVVSYTTFSPLPVSRQIVSVARSGRLPHPGCYPTFCSFECGLSSTVK